MAAAATVAQDAVPEEIVLDTASALDAGVADRGPLSRSLRVTPMDLRAPTGFERVYAVHPEGGEPIFERRSGALRAQFSQSVYAPTRFGDVALIPPGTVFKIGAPAAWERGPSRLGDAARPAGRSLDPSAGRAMAFSATGSPRLTSRPMRNPATGASAMPLAASDARRPALSQMDVGARARHVAALVARAAR